MMETPQITTSSYGTIMLAGDPWLGQQLESETLNDKLNRAIFRQDLHRTETETDIQITPQTMSRRIVKVFIADPHQDVPMDKAVLYQSEEKFTDATDQELFFEVGIKDILDKHNSARVKWLDREATKRAGKDIHLEPIKIRELKMVVVNIATF